MTTIQDFASHLDLANHHANATPRDIEKLCSEVVTHGFNGAFMNPSYTALAKQFLGNKAKIGTALSFPLGQDTVESKIFAAIQAIERGANELDIVPNNALVVTGDFTSYSLELSAIVSSLRLIRQDVVIKFIIETGYLPNDSLITLAAQAIVNAGADFVKICSGMGPRGASINDVKIVRKSIGDRAKIKVAGGIETLSQAQQFLEYGADRIGTSSAVRIIEEYQTSTA